MEALLGHHRLVDRLWSALDRGALHHALLFEGPVGVGKHTIALRLAMAANCAAAEARPCGVCPSCRQILSGNHPDVLVIEPDPEKATPTITVDQVREVVRLAGYHRFSGRRRMILVDPTEAMLPAAANALLKTLEEPPAGTGFVLIANHASTLLPTIVSRCQRYRFGPVPREELVGWLADRGHDDGELLARLSHGCPGRALDLATGGLDKRRDLRTALLEALSGDLGRVFAFSEKLTSAGSRQDWMVKVEAMLVVLEDVLRDAAAIGACGELDPARMLDPEVMPVAERWAEVLWPGGIGICADAITLARDNLAANVSGRTLVDALLVRIRAELGAARRAA